MATIDKPREIEGVLDDWLIRPLGRSLVALFRRTSITPNVVSMLSVVAALAAAVCYTERSLRGALGGLAFLIVTSALDSADGQLARVTGRGSRHGAAVDGLCDNLSFGAVYIAIFVSHARYVGTWTWAVAGLAVLAAASHSVQSALVDFVRQLYLRHTRGTPGPENQRPEALAAEIEKESGGPRLLLRLHLNYSREQRAFLPTSDRLERRHAELVDGRPDLAAAFAERYRAANQRLVRWWAVGASNIHKVGIAVTAFLPIVFTSGLFHQLGMTTYLFWDLALNVPLVAMIVLQRRSDRRLLAELEEMALSGGGAVTGPSRSRP